MNRYIAVTFATGALTLGGCPIVGTTNPPPPEGGYCGDTACREFDDVALEHAWEAGTYDIAVTDDAQSFSCTVTLPDGSDSNCDSTGIRLELNDAGDAIERVAVQTDAESIELEISLDGAILHEETVNREVMNNRSAECGECVVGTGVTVTF